MREFLRRSFGCLTGRGGEGIGLIFGSQRLALALDREDFLEYFNGNDDPDDPSKDDAIS
jgi:hypothetical protein